MRHLSAAPTADLLFELLLRHDSPLDAALLAEIARQHASDVRRAWGSRAVRRSELEPYLTAKRAAIQPVTNTTWAGSPVTLGRA